MERFTSTMSEKNWNTVLNDNDPQNAYTTFQAEFSEMYDACFPIKMFKEGYRTRKPWLSEEMKRSIKVKNKLYMHYKKSGNRDDEMVYKKYRNTLNKILVESERKHYESLLNENKSNLKKSWCILKEVINKKKASNTCSRFLVNGQITNATNKIANGFNKLFFL